MMKLLLQNYANVNSSTLVQGVDHAKTPLHLALCREFLETTKAFIDIGAWTDERDHKNRLPREIIADAKYNAVLKQQLNDFVSQVRRQSRFRS